MAGKDGVPDDKAVGWLGVETHAAKPTTSNAKVSKNNKKRKATRRGNAGL